MKKNGNKTIPIHVSNNPDDYEVPVSFQDMIFDLKIGSKKVKELNKVFSVLLSIAVPVIFVTAVLIRCGNSFESNDDLFLSGILSGSITGNVDYHTFFISNWITIPISLLYRLNASVPWWGLFLLSMIVLSNSCIIYYSLRNKPERVVIVPLADLALSFAYIYMIGEIQYTSVAILLAVAGYCCLIMEREKKSAVIWFFVLEFLSYCVRSKGMMLIQPFGFLTLFGICSAEKERIKLYFWKVLITCLLIIALGFLGKAITGENSKEAKEFIDFNKMREEIYDYGQSPSYSDVKEILDKYGVSEEQWKSFTDYSLQDWNMNSELSNELLKAVRKTRKKPSFNVIIREIYSNTVARKEAFPVLVMFFFSVIFMFLLMKLRYLRVLTGFVIAHLLTWGFLCYRGRVIDRVAIPLLFAECLFLLFTLLSMTDVGQVFEKKKVLKIIFVYAGLAGLIFVSFKVGLKPYRGIITDNETQKILTESFHQLEDYCNERQDEAFIIDINSVASVHGNALEQGLKPQVNYKWSGGWFSAMPAYKQSFSEYIGKERGFSYIVFDFGESWDRMENGTAKYYERLTGNRGVLTDRIKVSSGGEYLVYSFSKIDVS